MAYSEASKKATMKYQKEKLEQIAIRVPKGKREEYNNLAKIRGTSLTKLIVDYLESLLAESQE